jgi:hypothetical protein
MCDFPHNPAVFCIKAKVSNSKKYSKSKKFKCRGSLKLNKVIRPKGTYSYSDNLDLVEYKNDLELSLTTFKNKEIFAENCEQLNKQHFLVSSIGYDKWPELKDFSCGVLDKLKLNVTDPWKQKTVLIDCESIFKKRAVNE